MVREGVVAGSEVDGEGRIRFGDGRRDLRRGRHADDDYPDVVCQENARRCVGEGRAHDARVVGEHAAAPAKVVVVATPSARGSTGIEQGVDEPLGHARDVRDGEIGAKGRAIPTCRTSSVCRAERPTWCMKLRSWATSSSAAGSQRARGSFVGSIQVAARDFRARHQRGWDMTGKGAVAGARRQRSDVGMFTPCQGAGRSGGFRVGPGVRRQRRGGSCHAPPSPYRLAYFSSFRCRCRSAGANESSRQPSRPVRRCRRRTLAAQEADEDQALGEKLNGYIRDCLNRYSKSVHSAEERYGEWADAKKGPTGKERTSTESTTSRRIPSSAGPPSPSRTQRCRSKPDMEKLAYAYSAALVAVVPVINDAHKYYERGTTRTTRWPRGKQLHPKLVAAFETFDKADTDLSQLVDQVQEDLDKRELVRIEKEEGKKGHWHTVNTTLLAKPLLHEAAKDVTKINLAALSGAEDTYEKAVDAFETWATQNKAGVEQHIELPELGQRARHRRQELGAPHPRQEAVTRHSRRSWMGTSSGWMVEGSPDAVLDKYNKLVDAYNSVRY